MNTVAVDFDGVLHPYTDGWTGSVPADEPPMEGARGFLLALQARGYTVVIFSTRADHPDGYAGIVQWLEKWDLADLVASITHTKPPAVAYVDDRAVPFKPSDGWGVSLAAIDFLAEGRTHGAKQ
jgi:hypothetical protein